MFIISLLVFLLLSVYAFTKAESLDSFVVDLTVPEVPEPLWRDMESQIFPGEFNLTGYDWFTYYDPLHKRRVRTKFAGLSASHYASLAKGSFKLRYGNYDYRFKSIASELSQNPNPNEYHAFTEIGIYNIAKDFYNYAPAGKLVTLNGNRDEVMISWEEPWENNIRENDFVLWSALARNSLYAKDKQERYIPFAWNTRNQTRDDLIPQFIKLMNPIYEATILSPKDFRQTNFNFENMITYLALSNIFGSGHLDSHNLLFIPEINGDSYIWNMGLYDLAGLKSFVNPPVMQSLNPIYQYYLRSPKTAYLYQKRLYELNTSVLKSGMVSKFYRNISCDKVAKYLGFNELLLKSFFKGSKLIDLNYYCTLVDRISNYEVIRAVNLENQLNNTSLHWRLYKDKEDTYLALHVPSLVGVKVNSVRCGIFSCKGRFELINKPWWQDDNSWLLLSEPIREVRSWKSNLKPSHFTYVYKWTGNSEIEPDDVTIKAENIVTGKKVYPVKHIYPTFYIEVDKKSDDVFDMKLNIVNPMDVEERFEMKKSDIEEISKAEDRTKDWYITFKSSCIKTPKGPLEYKLDCSKYDKNAWPYPLNYYIELYYRDYKIHEYWGELYIDFSFSKTDDSLTKEGISKYKVTHDELLSSPGVSSKINEIMAIKPDSEIEELLGEASSIYYFPKNTTVDIADDLDLPKSSVVWFSEGATVKIWPLVNFKTGTLVSAGVEDQKVRITYKPGTTRWSRIEISNGGYIDYTTIEGHASNLGGVLATDSEMYITNSTLNGRYNLSCLSCDIYADDLTVIEGDWGVKARDSKLDISNVQATDILHVFILEDSIGTIENVTANRHMRTNGNIDKIFEVIGPASDIEINGVKTSNLNIFLSKHLYPAVDYDQVELTNTNREVLDLDNKYIYLGLVEMSADEFAQEYPFLKRDAQNASKFYFEDRRYELYEDVIIPESVTVVFEPGARVYFDDNKGIMSYGKVIAEGTEENPIFISAIDKMWGVFAFWGQSASGSFRYVTFNDGEDKFFTGTRYTGTLSAFSSSTLVVQNSVFKNSKGDDAINCYKSYCEIKDSHFENNDFDAIDFDFCEGVISNNTFEGNGNDSIDLSFDKSAIYNNKIRDSKDKGISVGEHSESLIYNNLIEQNNIGIEVKDDSEVSIVNNTITGNNIGINTYQKKRAFGGGGRANVFNSVLNNTVDTTSDKWTSIQINDTFNNSILEEIIYDLGVSPSHGMTN